MAKEDVVAAGVAAVQAADAQALSDQLGIAYDAGALDQKASDGTLSQGDLDAAVSAALATAKVESDAVLAAAQAVDAQALADAQAQGAVALDAVQAALDAMTAKEQLEEEAVADVAAKILSVQAAFDAIKAILVPVPVP